MERSDLEYVTYRKKQIQELCQKSFTEGYCVGSIDTTRKILNILRKADISNSEAVIPISVTREIKRIISDANFVREPDKKVSKKKKEEEEEIQEKIVCPKCGYEEILSEGKNLEFCPSCGERILPEEYKLSLNLEEV